MQTQVDALSYQLVTAAQTVLCLPLCTCRYVRFTQTKGHEAFTLRFTSCSYTSSVPFQYRDGGIMGVYMYMLPLHLCLHFSPFFLLYA